MPTLEHNYPEFASAVEGYKEYGDGRYIAKCPNGERHKHGDRRRSLVFQIGETGGIVFKCLSGCTKLEVLRSVSGYNPDNPWRIVCVDRLPNGFARSRRPAVKKIVKFYRYRSPAGDPWCDVVRYHPKTFRPARLAGVHAGVPAACGEHPVHAILPCWVRRVDDLSEASGFSWKPCGDKRDQKPSESAVWVDGVTQWPYNADLIAHTPNRLIFHCFSPDTEVLTPVGWVPIPDLPAGSDVCQWHTDGTMSFAAPFARQCIDHDGDMVHIESDWCDLMVTPDHRQPRKFTGSQMKVVPASELKNGSKLPVSGYLPDSHGGPSEDAVRLFAAWQADGVNESRGHKVSWSLKKQRKKDRLRYLLSANGIEWTEHCPESLPGYTQFRLSRDSMRDIMRLGSGESGKSWDMSCLSWPTVVRGAAIDEATRWDGDRLSDRSGRYFTGDKQSADVMSALAATSGWWSSVRIDRRLEKNDSYVVNLSNMRWRAVGYKPKRAKYSGKVYCLSVPSTFLLVRRGGKVTVSGNCEGEKDADTLVDHGFLATTTQGGSSGRFWSKDWAGLFRDRHVVLVPDHDKPGYDYSVWYAGCYVFAGAASVTEIRLPGQKVKGDVSDWFFAGKRHRDDVGPDSTPAHEFRKIVESRTGYKKLKVRDIFGKKRVKKTRSANNWPNASVDSGLTVADLEE